jgi:hypothetical protein
LKRLIFVAAGLAITAAQGVAKDKPAGDWQVLPIALEQPIVMRVGGATGVTLLKQQLVPEAVKLTRTDVTLGGATLPTGSVLFRTSVKAETVWCDIAPFQRRLKPGEAAAGRTPCLADGDNDGRFDRVSLGTATGAPVPDVTKLGPAQAISPVAAVDGDPAAVAGWTVELRDGRGGTKNKPSPRFYLMLISPAGISQLDETGLVTGGAEFATIYNLGAIHTRSEAVEPARLSMGPIGPDGQAEARIEKALAVRRLALGKHMRIAKGGHRRIHAVAPHAPE